MAKRSDIALKNQWPRRCVLRAFHDKVYRALYHSVDSKDFLCAYTSLKDPLTVAVNAKWVPTTWIRELIRGGLCPHVWPETNSELLMQINP